MSNEKKTKAKVGSGKQVLSLILADLSTTVTAESELSLATDRLRAGLLLHGSTADETYEIVSRLTWASSLDDEGDVTAQGIAIGNGAVLISDFFEEIMDIPKLKQKMLKRYPELQPDDYEAGILAIWLILSSVQTFTCLLPAEVESSRIDVDGWVKSMMRHYRYYFDQKGA